MIFSDLYGRVQIALPDMSGGRLVQVKNTINDVITEIARDHPLDVFYVTKSLIVDAPYSTGTVKAVLGNGLIEGTGTTFTPYMVGRAMVIADGDIVRRISRYVSATLVAVTPEWAAADATGQTYAIYDDQPTVAHDMQSIVSVSLPDESRPLTMRTIKLMTESYPSPTDMGTPYLVSVCGYSTTPYYNTGAVSIMTLSAACVGVGTTFTQAMVGRWLRVGLYTKEYPILSVTSATALTLGRTFQDSTVSARPYEIDPMPNLQLWLYPMPNARMVVSYTGYRKPKMLYGDEDTPDVPESWLPVIIAEAKYRLRKDRGEPPERLAVERDDWYRAYRKLFGTNPRDIGRVSQLGLYCPESDFVTQVQLPADWAWQK